MSKKEEKVQSKDQVLRPLETKPLSNLRDGKARTRSGARVSKPLRPVPHQTHERYR